MADDEKDLELRRSFKFRLLQNPNYFGNLTDLKLPDLPGPVLQKVGDTTYEELTCIGYNPDTDILTAIVRVKLGSGYSGGPCTDGSREYVRFYLDYGPGGWVDHGVASFVIHDLGFGLRSVGRPRGARRSRAEANDPHDLASFTAVPPTPSRASQSSPSQ